MKKKGYLIQAEYVTNFLTEQNIKIIITIIQFIIKDEGGLKNRLLWVSLFNNVFLKCIHCLEI